MSSAARLAWFFTLIVLVRGNLSSARLLLADDDICLETLLENHDKWVGDNSRGSPQPITGGVIQKKDLKQKKFSSVSISKCTLIDVVLSRSSWNDATLKDCTLIRCNFQDVNFTGARFEKCRFEECNFNYAKLIGLSCENTEFLGCKFNSADLTGCHLSLTRFIPLPPERRDKEGPKSRSTVTSLRQSLFIPSDMNACDFVECDFSEAQLRYRNGSKTVCANFYDESDKLRVNHSSGNSLEGSMFHGVNMAGVKIVVRPESKLSSDGFGSAANLGQIVILGSLAPFSSMQADLKAQGNRLMAREVTCAIRRAERSEMVALERIVSWMLFDLTCEYGANHLRPAGILLASVVCGAIIIVIVCSNGCGILYKANFPHNKPEELWRVRMSAFAVGSYGAAIAASLLAHSRLLGIGDVSANKAVLAFMDCDDIKYHGRWLQVFAAVMSVLGVFLFGCFVMSYVWTPIN